ncbi:hypothetical protein CROQUDRAFT_50505, partial [Cronartium quercuum f. sp. fusiforme G11]
AKNKVLQHIPVMLHYNDTSGNGLKKWNKHLGFYYTLAGLHPKLTNQECHIDYVTSSNTAGTQELAA